MDPRPACDCLEQPGPALDAKMAEARRELDKLLGPAEELPNHSTGEAHGYPPDPRERAVRWKREGYTLTLMLGAEEFGWSVELQAFRGW